MVHRSPRNHSLSGLGASRDDPVGADDDDLAFSHVPWEVRVLGERAPCCPTKVQLRSLPYYTSRRMRPRANHARAQGLQRQCKLLGAHLPSQIPLRRSRHRRSRRGSLKAQSAPHLREKSARCGASISSCALSPGHALSRRVASGWSS